MRRIGTSYKQHPPSGAFDAIVVGSGMGGLTTAALLARIGHKRVLVLEQHYTAGGFTHSFHRPGYEWDVGVHYVGQVSSERRELRPYFDFITGGQLQWAKLPPVYDRIILGERSYDLVSGKKQFASQMKSYFPSEATAIDRYLSLVRSCAVWGAPFFGERVLPSWAGAVAGPALRWPFQRLARRTVTEVLSELTSNQELIRVLSGQCGDYGLPPSRASFAIHAAVVGHYLDGAWFPVGGASEIARTIEPVITAAGGLVSVSAEVERILVENGRATGVRMIDGRELRAPIVVSDAGLRLTLSRLLPDTPAPSPLREAFQQIPPSVAHVCLYLGMKKTDSELGLSGTNLWIYPDGDFDRALERFIQNPEGPLPVVYVSFPSAKDPSFSNRYPGRSTIDVITLMPWERFSAWEGTRWKKRGAEYDAAKARITDRLMEVVYAKLPQLRGQIDVQELSTPVTTQHFAAHPTGELYGLEHSPARFELPLRAATHVPGLFLTGADLTTCGVAGALLGGVVSATAILRRNVPGAVMTARA